MDHSAVVHARGRKADCLVTIGQIQRIPSGAEAQLRRWRHFVLAFGTLFAIASWHLFCREEAAAQMNAMDGDMEEDSAICPLGGAWDDPAPAPLPGWINPFASGTALQPHAEASKCVVCRSLVPFNFPLSPRGTPMTTDECLRFAGLLPPSGYIAMKQAQFGPLLYHDYFFSKKWTPPWPQATKWIKSAMAGCRSCQIVVDSVSAFCPGWFFDIANTPDALERDLFDNKIIIAWAKHNDRPMSVWLIDTDEEWLHRWRICLEVFTHPGTLILILDRVR
jgi:hypothetical protein